MPTTMHINSPQTSMYFGELRLQYPRLISQVLIKRNMGICHHHEHSYLLEKNIINLNNTLVVNVCAYLYCLCTETKKEKTKNSEFHRTL